MAKIIIIGNSASGFSALGTFLKNSPGNELTIISKEEYPAYKKNLLLDYLSGNVKEDEIFFCNQDFYGKNNCNFKNNSEVARVDTKKRRVILKDNAKLDYDYLIIASGQKIDIPDIPGKTKDGIFTFCELGDVKTIKQRLILSNTICLIGEAGLCMRLAEKFLAKDKEVKIISKIRPENFTAPEKMEWIDGLELSEFIGEGRELSALKLSNGKVIGTTLVIFAGNYSPASEFLKETSIKTNDGYIIVDDSMRTNLENVFACGCVCKKDSILAKEKLIEDAVSEGVIAAESILKSFEGGKTLCQQTS